FSFKCFGCGESGDIFSWYEKFHHLNFTEALKKLSENESSESFQSPVQEIGYRQPSLLAEPPDGRWQMNALELIEEGQELLWGPTGGRARNYLNGRGFSDEIIRSARLGYHPGRPWDRDRVGGRRWHGIWIAYGILIPVFADGSLWGIKVRRADGKPKYVWASGGNGAGALYGADGVQLGAPLLVVEGEFNALAALQAAGDLLGVVSLGSASTTLNVRWMSLLASCSPLLVCLDQDNAGDKGAASLSGLSGRIRRITVPPPHKDLNEMLQAQSGAIRPWLETEIAEARAEARSKTPPARSLLPKCDPRSLRMLIRLAAPEVNPFCPSDLSDAQANAVRELYAVALSVGAIREGVIWDGSRMQGVIPSTLTPNPDVPSEAIRPLEQQSLLPEQAEYFTKGL
ncbi:MAG: toprim domain-containing protein, partial [Anaerolineae bacterium]|nr:toprim domain-containing protein [Anaerolineae bacterium]